MPDARSTVTSRPPSPAADAMAADWIAFRLLDEFGAVCTTVPTGFAAYARILHPIETGAGTAARWSEVAARYGRTVHALAQFDRIAPPDERGDLEPPRPGSLAADQLRTLCRILGRHLPDAARCYFAVWEGWGELTGATSMLTFATSGGETPPPPPSAPAEWQLDLRASTFKLPHRRYYLFFGPLDDATRIGHWATRDWFVPRSPNLFWPDDRSWCAATEIDFDSTLVGGSAELIADLLADERLEAWQVHPHDSLAWDGDEINRP